MLALLLAAALIPFPESKVIVPAPGFEPNRGQSPADLQFLARGATSLGISAQSILYYPRGLRQSFVNGNADAPLRYLDPLPGVANYYSGRDPAKWVVGVPRFAVAQYTAIYPGVDAQYRINAAGGISLRLLLAPGASPQSIQFDIGRVEAMSIDQNGSILTRIGPSRLETFRLLSAPAASRPGTTIRYEIGAENGRFGFRITGHDPTFPLTIEVPLSSPGSLPSPSTIAAADGVYAVDSIPAAAGSQAPFTAERGVGCGSSILVPLPCFAVAAYRFAPSSELSFVTYLYGAASARSAAIHLDPTGVPVITGTTDSADFPVTPGAFQSSYAGPAATAATSASNTPQGDYFAARLHPVSGQLLASTFFGGPGPDSIGESTLGPDGSVYFLPKFLVSPKAGLPVSANALMPLCPGEVCLNGHAARLSPNLDTLLFGTYLPGISQATARLHTDGSIYYAGSAANGFPAAPNAYQPNHAGGERDGIVVRLHPSGTRLLAATYLGGPVNDWILNLTVAPDGSPWVALSSFVACCIDIDYRVLRLDPLLQSADTQLPLDVGDMTTDRDGNLLATAANFLHTPCRTNALSYVKLSPAGVPIFAASLPQEAHYEFTGYNPSGLPVIRIGEDRFEVDTNTPTLPNAACLTNAASAADTANLTAPGAIVSLFGFGLGPLSGASSQLQDGRLPDSIDGTRVLVNGAPVPLLYASYSQINAILPFNLPLGSQPVIQVERAGLPGNELNTYRVQPTAVALFAHTNSALRPAAALNEDGTVNSLANPAKPGSRVVLFGTGGGQTTPPGTAGQTNPLAPAPLQNTLQIAFPNGELLPVEYAGAAPGLLAGVIQINIKLPDDVPSFGDHRILSPTVHAVPLAVTTSDPSIFTGFVTIAVQRN